MDTTHLKREGAKSTNWIDTGLQKLNDANSCVEIIKMEARHIQKSKGAPTV